MTDDDSPLVVVVSEDPRLLEQIRQRLRAAGVVPVPGRCVGAAISLLTQVRVNGCVLAQDLAPRRRKSSAGRWRRSARAASGFASGSTFGTPGKLAGV